VRLGDIAREIVAKSDEQDLPVYSVTKHAGFVPSLEFFTKQVFSRDTSGYKLVRRNQFAYATIHLDEGSLGLLTSTDAALISPMYTVFEADAERVHPSYLYRVLKAPQMLGIYSRLGKGTVHRRKAISFERLASLSVPLPGLGQQKHIADIIERADRIRRSRKEGLFLAEELLRSAFLDMFGDPMTNPKGWELKRLAQLGRITTGNTPPRAAPQYFGDDIEWIKSDNINTPSHYLSRATEGLSAEGRKIGRTAPAGSTLMTCIAGSPDCIGNVALADREVAFNQQINAVTPYEGVDCRFLYVLLLVGKQLVQAASTNSMKGMVSKGKLEDVKVPSPPPTIQERFGNVFDHVLRLSRRHERAYNDANALFEATVQRAFSASLTGTPAPC